MKNYASDTQETASSAKDVFAVLGTTLQWLSTPAQNQDDICVMIGSIPSGVVIPLHSHADPEIIYILEGTVEVYEEQHGRWRWVAAGDVITIPCNVKHALRNSSISTMKSIVVSKKDLYNFFQELARPVVGEALPIPDPMEKLALFEAVEQYGYWLASSDENAEIGLFPR